MSVYSCANCGVELEAKAHLCVSCFRELTTVCICRTQKWGPKDKRHKIKGYYPPIPHCQRCGGQGWVTQGIAPTLRN